MQVRHRGVWFLLTAFRLWIDGCRRVDAMNKQYSIIIMAACIQRQPRTSRWIAEPKRMVRARDVILLHEAKKMTCLHTEDVQEQNHSRNTARGPLPKRSPQLLQQEMSTAQGSALGRTPAVSYQGSSRAHDLRDDMQGARLVDILDPVHGN
ncbi:hypothetical protein N431DRAFT_151568 [Stipitochalara longipes BDJ]|nr:hypothetical protein N431DRAFT_151568 [Stipitochalara longipes BDJ]